MPWRCPACRTHITHNPVEATPREGDAYRCHLCRIELLYNPVEDRMDVAPFEIDETSTPMGHRRGAVLERLNRELR